MASRIAGRRQEPIDKRLLTEQGNMGFDKCGPQRRTPAGQRSPGAVETPQIRNPVGANGKLVQLSAVQNIMTLKNSRKADFLK
jgi:hypothetical protein